MSVATGIGLFGVILLSVVSACIHITNSLNAKSNGVAHWGQFIAGWEFAIIALWLIVLFVGTVLDDA